MKISNNYRWLFSLLALIYGITILSLARLSRPLGYPLDLIPDYILHPAGFALLTLLLCCALTNLFQQPFRWYHGLIILGSSVLVSLLDELLQMDVPQRDASFRDLMLDATGIFYGLVLICLLIVFFNRKRLSAAPPAE